MPRRLALLVLAAACAAPPPPPPPPPAPVVKPPPPPSARTVIQAMNDRYIGKWYMVLTYKQNVSIIAANGRETRQVWNHYLTLPGRQRIDYVPLATRSGVLYVDGRLYSFTNGRQQGVQPGWNPQLVLTGDAYTQMVDTTLAQLDSLGFDLSLARKDTWGGKEAWVVGAAPGDTTASQFWVDTDSLLVRRLLVREQRAGRPVVTETRFLNYRSVAGYPVAYTVRGYRDGRLYFRGEATNVLEGLTLPVELFEPANWAASQLKR